MSMLVVISDSNSYESREVLSSLNDSNSTGTHGPKTQGEILGNSTLIGNKPSYQTSENKIYYQVKTGSILNPISITNAGFRINNILYDNDQTSIVLVLTPGQNKSGGVEIDLPRNIIDSKINERDKNFTVLVNNQPAKYQEIIDNNNLNTSSSSVGSNMSSSEYAIDSDSRKLVIEFGKDARIIKIIGTELYNMTGQNQSGIDITKSNNIQDGDRNPFLLIFLISFALGVIIVVGYFKYRKKRFKSNK